MTPVQLARFTSPPVDLGSDSSGPYWLRREGATAVVEDLSGEAARHDIDPNPRLPLSLVAGSTLPLYIRGGHLWAGSELLTGGISPRPWEEAAAAMVGGQVLVRAFHVAEEDENGMPVLEASGWAILSGEDGWAVPTDPRGFWSPAVAVAGLWVAFARRLGASTETEVQDAAALGDGWLPARRRTTARRTPRGSFWGDPSVSVGADGKAHAAASLWRRWRPTRTQPRDYSHQLPEVAVDGVTVVSDSAVGTRKPGETTPAREQWIPALCAVPDLGLCLGWQSSMPTRTDPGEVTVGLLSDGRLVGRRAFPGFGARLAAVWGRRAAYVATDIGLWGPG